MIFVTKIIRVLVKEIDEEMNRKADRHSLLFLNGRSFVPGFMIVSAKPFGAVPNATGNSL
jgi:hypothetical protein